MLSFKYPASAFLSLFLAVTGANAALYSAHRNLEDYCGRTLEINCPYSYGEAGTLRFLRIPGTACKVTVTLSSSSCGLSYEYFAIYLNIRSLYTPENSRMEIYDTSSIRTLGKSWNGGYTPQNSNPTSAGQYLSKYARQPEISIEFTPSLDNTPAFYHEVVFEYVILSDTSSDSNARCSALNGYVSDNYICDTDNDRCNCPYAYTPYVYSMSPAGYRQQCAYELSGGAIAGIAIGCFAFVVVIIVITALVGKRRRPRTKTPRVAFISNGYSETSVALTPQEAPPPYPAQAYAAPPYPAATSPLLPVPAAN
ncbi:uncharacterized protein LOC129595553 [Paramacrobiotus metropolitanus]|uniref:uncharacterized protein LOC129595553 n=1 Tax=Paramacrobiotus metropolitanus TaxID=2943436 RepID=UPI0024463ABA|nr:uncharacterized protein LOC129595553 [Paramacrobiotus metropolitanus]